MKRAAIYARVSTKNNGQNPETQLVPLREYVQNREWPLAAEYVDHGVSGSKDSRPVDRLMEDARVRKVDVIVVARFDRFARSDPPPDPSPGGISAPWHGLHQPQ